MMNKNLTEATEINADDLNNMLDESENIADDHSTRAVHPVGRRTERADRKSVV